MRLLITAYSNIKRNILKYHLLVYLKSNIIWLQHIVIIKDYLQTSISNVGVETLITLIFRLIVIMGKAKENKQQNYAY